MVSLQIKTLVISRAQHRKTIAFLCSIIIIMLVIRWPSVKAKLKLKVKVKPTWYLLVELNGTSQPFLLAALNSVTLPIDSSTHFNNADSLASPLHSLHKRNINLSDERRIAVGGLLLFKLSFCVKAMIARIIVEKLGIAGCGCDAD